MGWHLHPEEETIFQAHCHQGSQESGMVAALASERCHNNMAKLKDNKDFRGIKELPSHATTHGSKTCLFRLGTIALPDAGRGGCLNGLAGKMGRRADFNSVSPAAHTQEEAPVVQPRAEAPQETLDRFLRLSSEFVCGT